MDLGFANRIVCESDSCVAFPFSPTPLPKGTFQISPNMDASSDRYCFNISDFTKDLKPCCHLPPV